MSRSTEANWYGHERPRTGKVLIINNLSKAQLPTQTDVKNVYDTLTDVGLDVDEPMLDLTSSETQTYLKEAIGEHANYSKYNMLVLYVIAHGVCTGEGEDCIMGTDREPISVHHELIKPICAIRSMLNMPKVLFIDACRIEGEGYKSATGGWGRGIHHNVSLPLC